MTTWERFGDDTWINVDHVEVVKVEQQEDGRWQLIAAFTSGRTYPIGIHDDRELLAECTDAILRGQVGERLRDLTAPDAGDGETATPGLTPVATPEQPRKRRWWGRVAGLAPSSTVVEQVTTVDTG